MNDTVSSNRKILFTDSSPLLGDPAALNARAREDGFLFFKRMLPREAILELREAMLEVVDRRGWREPGQNRLGGRINLEAINRVPDDLMRSDIGVSSAAYVDAMRIEILHAMPHHPRLLEFYRSLLGCKVLVHPRHIARMITGHRVVSPTPPHQDFPLIQGTPNTWTCWIPLGDCPRTHGGLSILKGSHRKGYLPIQPSKGAGGIAVPLCPEEVEWAEGDYEAGDIITFPSYTIHKALRSECRSLIRLSLDVRFQPADEPVEQRSLLPHCDSTWEELYCGWKREDLQYYWQNLDPRLVPWDDSLMQPGRRIC